MRTKPYIHAGLTAGLLLAGAGASAAPAVYTGAYNYNEGSLDNATDWQQVTNFVTAAQKDLSIINDFFSWTSGSSTNGTETFPTTTFNDIRNHGSMPLFTWQPENSSQGVTQSFSLASIAAGSYDSYLTTWATAAKTWGHPFFLRFAHEMNGSWYPWCAGTNGNTSAQYIQMWRHVHDIFTGVGATNVTWVWCVNTSYSGSTPIAGLYPGDNYVDWVSLDAYNRLANSWQDFSNNAAGTVAQLISIAPGKPIMVAETGCNQNTNYSKSQWFLNVLTNYLPSQPRIKAWVYENSTNQNDGNDWRITVPTNATPGYQQGIALPYYATNQYGTIASFPIQPLLADSQATDTMPPFVAMVSPVTDSATNGQLVQVIALASDKSGVSNVVFAVNGVPVQTNSAAPYQYAWTVPYPGGSAYTLTATATDNAGNSAVSTVQVVSQDGSIVTLTNSDALGYSSLTGATNWDSGLAPAAGFDYVVPAGYQLRTPADNGAYAFAGDSLTLAGTLACKQTNVVTVSDLELTNGLVVTLFAGGNPDTGRLAGYINVVTNAIIDAGGNNGGTTGMQIYSTIGGSGGLTFIRANAVTLSNTNSYNGPVVVAGTLLVLDGAASLTPSSLTLSNYVNAGTGYGSVSNLVLAGGSLTVTGGPSGVLRVGYRNTAGTNCAAVLDVSTQPMFTVNVGEFSVGVNLYNDGFTSLGTAYLATNNNVTATNLFIGFSADTGGGTSSMTLGGGSNYFNTPILTVGGQKEGGQLTLPAGGVFRLDNGAARAELTVGGQNFATGVSCAGVADLSGGTFSGSLDALVIGQKAGGNTGGASGTLTLSSNAANSVNANTVLIGSLAGATNSTPVAQGVLTFGGGTFLVNSNVTLGSLSGTNGTATGTLNINGGVFAIAGNLADGGGTTALNVNGGRLDLKPAGDATAGNVTVDSLVLNGVITNVAAVTVTNLSGSGSVVNQTGVTTVTGSLKPGGAGQLGTLTAGSLVISGTTVMELNRTNPPNADGLAAGTIAFGGTLTVTNLGGTLLADDRFQLFTGTLSGTFTATNLPALAYTNLYWDTTKLRSQGVLAVAATVAPPSVTLAPGLSGTNLTVQTGSQAGFNYILQATAQLNPANWAAVQTNAGGGTLTFMIPLRTAGPREFYRVYVP